MPGVEDDQVRMRRLQRADISRVVLAQPMEVAVRLGLGEDRCQEPEDRDPACSGQVEEPVEVLCGNGLDQPATPVKRRFQIEIQLSGE